MLPVFSLILLGIAIYVAAVFFANRTVSPHEGPIPSSPAATNLPVAQDTLTILTWNIGYGALGKNADLIVENGRSLRALSAKEVRDATQRIAHRLAAQSADVICLQENAKAGFLTRGVGVSAIVETALADRQSLFWTDMKSVLVPRFLRLEHGMSVHARIRIDSCTAVLFPKDNVYFWGGLTKHYGSLISHIGTGKTGRDWVVFNIHLSAFDPDIRTRMEQLENLLQREQHEYDQGHFVVIAGDWNMRLSPTDVAHDKDPKEKLQMLDFPRNVLKQGWTMTVGTEIPTVSPLNSPSIAGQSDTAIIDRFVYSPTLSLPHVSPADQTL